MQFLSIVNNMFAKSNKYVENLSGYNITVLTVCSYLTSNCNLGLTTYLFYKVTCHNFTGYYSLQEY